MAASSPEHDGVAINGGQEGIVSRELGKCEFGPQKKKSIGSLKADRLQYHFKQLDSTGEPSMCILIRLHPRTKFE